MRIYMYVHTTIQREGESKEGREGGARRGRASLSAALLDMLTLTYISQLFREPYLPLMSVIASL